MHCLTVEQFDGADYLNYESRVETQVKLENPEEKTILNIPSAVRGDTGKYTIKAKNEFGEDSGDFKVIVLGKVDFFQLRTLLDLECVCVYDVVFPYALCEMTLIYASVEYLASVGRLDNAESVKFLRKTS